MADDENPPPGTIAWLVRKAGARLAPSQSVAERVRAAVYRQYIAELASRRRKRWSLAAAAGIALLTATIVLVRESKPLPVAVAEVGRVVGEPASLYVGQVLRSGER